MSGTYPPPEFVLNIWCGKCGESSNADKWLFDCIPSDTWVKWAAITCPLCKQKHKIQGQWPEDRERGLT